jgi:HAE1 family hydrophobic/amphiphilic exporter-1
MTSRITKLTSVFLAAVCVVFAQAQSDSSEAVIDAPARVGVSIAETRLTLQQAIELAIRNNLDVEIERTNVANAGQGIKAAQGAFDPIIRFQPTWESATLPASSILQGAGGRTINRSWGSNLSLVQPFTNFGTTLNADFDNSRIATNNPFTTLNPYFNSRLLIGISQPLLRGLRTDAMRTQLTIRRKDLDVAETAFRLQAIGVIARVEEAYWDLLAARQDVGVKQESVALAQEQLATSQRLVAAGTLAEVELSASEAELERRRDDLYTSIANLTTTENRLKNLLSPDVGNDIWNTQIIPVDRTRASDVPTLPDVAALVKQALTDRLELRQLEQRGDIVDAQKRLAADQRLPQVNLIAGYVNTGLAGSMRAGDNPLTASNAALYTQVNQLSAIAGLRPITTPSPGGLPPGLVGDYGSSLSNLLSGNYQTFQAGVSIDLNLRNRTAEANLAQAEIAARRLSLERRRAEQAINQQVRDSLQLMESAQQRVTAAEASARAAKEKLDSETRLFQSGESTNFLVLTRQNEFANSRLRVVVANSDLNRARARLELALGGTLRNFSVQLQ